MRKIALSLVTVAMLSSGAMGAETLEEALSEGEFSGVFRTFYIDRTYNAGATINRNSLSVGGYFGYETAPWNGLSIGAKGYSTNKVDIHGSSTEATSYDPSLFGDGLDSYTFLGELYMNYKRNNTTFKVGRQRLDTPMAGSDEARMLPNLFEAAVLSNTDLKDTTLILAHVTKETVGTFGNIYADGIGNLGIQSGYGYGLAVDGLGLSGEFEDMGEIALGTGADTDGVTAAAAIYKGIPGLTLQAWDYYAHDILNALYLQADYGWDCLLNSAVKMNASAQYIYESEVGDELAGDVNSNYFGAKLGAAYNALSGFVAFSTTGSDDATVTNGGIISPWGGMPAFTQGMVTRHMFFADTDAWKAAATYNLKDLGMPLVATAYYTSYDIGADNTYQPGTAWEAEESGLDFSYIPDSMKNVEFKLRANFTTDFAPGTDWDEYRFIVNYNF
ncbi:MAG: OprD family porin [Sulfurovum sp.]|nr:OprD family porin [Sulfurovum sp.]